MAIAIEAATIIPRPVGRRLSAHSQKAELPGKPPQTDAAETKLSSVQRQNPDEQPAVLHATAEIVTKTKPFV
ncbi:hypothetical protein NKJ23_33835 [Mesorhizobium sp. M0184]|uniref:hypothetical protein n=1 Tax=Mesorhizobium sp. M0184 TaxID=2956906 RepID=UPI00333DEB5F